MVTFNLGYALALKHKNVTLIDLDPEANLSHCCALQDEEGISQLLLEEQDKEQVSYALAEGFNVIPTGMKLQEVQERQQGLKSAYKLKEVIDTMTEQDIILLDCPSKPSRLTLNALFAADEVMIPVKANFLSIQGLVRIVHLFKKLKKISGGAKLWLLINQVSTTDSKISSGIIQCLQENFPKRVLQTKIRQDEALMESQRQGQAIFDFKQDSAGANDCFALAEDLLEGRAY